MAVENMPHPSASSRSHAPIATARPPQLGQAPHKNRHRTGQMPKPRFSSGTYSRGALRSNAYRQNWFSGSLSGMLRTLTIPAKPTTKGGAEQSVRFLPQSAKKTPPMPSKTNANRQSDSPRTVLSPEAGFSNETGICLAGERERHITQRILGTIRARKICKVAVQRKVAAQLWVERGAHQGAFAHGHRAPVERG